MENLVESVEFHPESGRTNLIFEHFPPGFQHVEKMIGPLRIVYHIFVENFSRFEKNMEKNEKVRLKYFLEKMKNYEKYKQQIEKNWD